MAATGGNSGTLFNNSRLSDIKIKQIKDDQFREYYAHKALLSADSKYSRTLFVGNPEGPSADIVELHGDDSIYFEVCLKSIYGGRCDFALLRSRERTGFMLDILKAIDVMELAVKYDSKVLFQSMTGYIVGLTSVVPATRRFAILEATIDAHYGVGTRMRSPVDKVLAVLASSEGGWFVRTTDFKNLISRYSAFATDVALVSMQDSTIDMLRHFCDECDSKTMVTWQEVQESGRQLIRCWACGLLARIPMRPSQSEEHILPSRLARCYSFEE